MLRKRKKHIKYATTIKQIMIMLQEQQTKAFYLNASDELCSNNATTNCQMLCFNPHL